MDFEKIFKDISNNLFFLTSEEIESFKEGMIREKERRISLMQLGEDILGLEILTVLDKIRIAPSGDKRDYVSFGTYWWPNPDTPEGLPYVVRDGEFNPEGFEYDKYNMKKTLYSGWLAGLIGLITEDERYIKRFQEVIKKWFIDEESGMNPHLKYAQFIPGICEGRDIGLIDTATILPFLLNIYTLFSEKGWVERETDREFREWTRRYLEWILESPHGAGENEKVNNHGTWHDIQVTALAEFCNLRDLAEKQFLRGVERFESQIDHEGKQVFEITRTRSLNYSVMGLRGQMDLLLLGEKIGKECWNDERIRRGCEWILPYITGEREWEYQQITAVDEEIGIYPVYLMREKLKIESSSNMRSDKNSGIASLLFT